MFQKVENNNIRAINVNCIDDIFYCNTQWLYVLMPVKSNEITATNRTLLNLVHSVYPSHFLSLAFIGLLLRLDPILNNWWVVFTGSAQIPALTRLSLSVPADIYVRFTKIAMLYLESRTASEKDIYNVKQIKLSYENIIRLFLI